jgi:hypothetical protein
MPNLAELLVKEMIARSISIKVMKQQWLCFDPMVFD